MAKRTRIIEGTWNCSSCGRRDIPARIRTCPACNNPREEVDKESEFDFGGVDAASGKALRESVTDEKALEAAGAGADWFCEYCGASNRGDNRACRHCRAQRSDASRMLARDEEPPDPAEQPSGKARLAPRRPPPPAPAPPPAAKPSRRRWVYVVLGLVASCGTLLFWGGRTRDVTGQVTDTAWTRTTHRQTFERIQREGWRNELSEATPRMPVNGQGEAAGVENIRFCTSRQRSTRQVADGTERVCSTKQRQVQCGTEERCSRQNMGNGFQKEVCNDVPKYCSESYEDCETRTRYRTEPVFDTSCTYDTYAWKEVEHKTASGHNDTPVWPELPTGPLDRLNHEEHYTVQVSYKDGGPKEHALTPDNEKAFLRWKKGQSVPLRVNNFGSVELGENVKH